MVYIGVDVALTRPLDIVVLNNDLALIATTPQPDAIAAAQYIASHYEQAWVAVDGPRRPNYGLMANRQYQASLNPPPPPGKFLNHRVCEYELGRRNIPSFPTPAGEPKGWKQWMKAAYQLYESLHELGFADFVNQDCLPGKLMLEYFPYASFCVLAGRQPGKKSTHKGQGVRRELLRKYGVRGDIAGLTVDQIDALVGAVTAHALHHGQASWVGDKDEGLLVVPKKLRDTYR